MGYISQTFSPEDWCIVGGMMVLIASRAEGASSSRGEETRDADVVVDVCVQPRLLQGMASKLESFGYEQDPPFRGDGFARCSFSDGIGQIDLLAPNDSQTELLAISDSSMTIAIPGGRRALELSETIELYFGEEERDVAVRVPLLPGAIVVKAMAALDLRTKDQPRHLEDVAYLLGALSDPSSARLELDDSDVEVLTKIGSLFDLRGSGVWRGESADFRDRALATLAILTSPSGVSDT
jgi:hypothetical protein